MAYTAIDKPSDYFVSNLHTGTGSSNAISGIGFAPDWVWIKNRGATGHHMLFDKVRGATKVLYSDITDAETTVSGHLTSFDSDGFTLGNNDGKGSTNGNTETYVAWNWKAETSFTNDASSTSIGSIDSAGNVNDTAGFSIVSFTGNGSSGATIKHGLSTAPKIIMAKNRSRTADWLVFSSSMSSNGDFALFLQSTSAKDNSQDYWGDTAPTSSVFSVGNRQENNQSGENIIAYCFSERKGYSKFGKYTSINSHDSTFVYLGFKPSMIIFKNTSYSGGSDWHILDRTRYTFNGSSEAVLEPNTSDAENYSAFGEVDFLSNGFKIRNNNGISSGGYNHIYMAFAENPFVTSTGVPATAR